jgi:phospholipase C
MSDPLAPLASDPIEHVVVVMLENQSFDRVLGCMKPVNPAIDGVDPAQPGSNPDPTGGTAYVQAPDAPRVTIHDPGHDLDDLLRQIERGCRGSVSDYATKYPNSRRSERQQVLSGKPILYCPNGYSRRGAPGAQ